MLMELTCLVAIRATTQYTGRPLQYRTTRTTPTTPASGTTPSPQEPRGPTTTGLTTAAALAELGLPTAGTPQTTRKPLQSSTRLVCRATATARPRPLRPVRGASTSPTSVHTLTTDVASAQTRTTPLAITRTETERLTKR